MPKELNAPTCTTDQPLLATRYFSLIRYLHKVAFKEEAIPPVFSLYTHFLFLPCILVYQHLRRGLAQKSVALTYPVVSSEGKPSATEFHKAGFSQHEWCRLGICSGFALGIEQTDR